MKITHLKAFLHFLLNVLKSNLVRKWLMGKVMLISHSRGYKTRREVKMSLCLNNEALPPVYIWGSGSITPFFFNLVQSSLSLDNRTFTYDMYLYRFWWSCYFRWSELYIYSRCVLALLVYGIISHKAPKHRKPWNPPYRLFWVPFLLWRGTWWHGWGTALHVGRSQVRFPMVSLEFFIDTILPAALWPWGWQSL